MHFPLNSLFSSKKLKENSRQAASGAFCASPRPPQYKPAEKSIHSATVYLKMFYFRYFLKGVFYWV